MRRKSKKSPGKGPGAASPAVLWFTGLSGSGKSTIAVKLGARLKRMGTDVELLDGDSLRAVFPNTGFRREDRIEHVKRAGFLAALLEKHGVFVIASFISPYRESRDFVRKLCRRFIEVHISTSLAECERRDVKGLYARARRGEIRNFTGISDPYEPPRRPELRIDTAGTTVDEACNKILAYLAGAGK